MRSNPPLRNRTVISLLLAGALVGGLTGCDSPPEDANQVERVTQAVTNADFFDPAGNFFVRVKTCDFVGPAARNVTTCSVDPDFGLIGGGAEVEGNTPNALLTGSFPAFDKVTWWAGSKDHQVSSPHRLRAYAIGLRVFGMDGPTLRSRLNHIEVTSAAAHHPTATVNQPGGFFVAGGGVWVNFSGPGALLTESFSPDRLFQWKGSSKDHNLPEVHTIRVASIGIPVCPANFCFTFQYNTASHFVNTGFALPSVQTPAGFVPAAVGGQATFSGAGRLLTKLVPFVPTGLPGAQVQSKDHVTASAGTTNAWALSIKTF